MIELKLKLSADTTNYTPNYDKHLHTLKYEILNYADVQHIPNYILTDLIGTEFDAQKIIDSKKIINNTKDNTGKRLVWCFIASSINSKRDDAVLTHYFIFEEYINHSEIDKKENSVIKDAPIDVTVEIIEQ